MYWGAFAIFGDTKMNGGFTKYLMIEQTNLSIAVDVVGGMVVMAQPGDVIPTPMGWSEVVSHVNDDGKPTGGFLVPPGNDELIADLVAFIKEPIDPKAVIREAERIIEDSSLLDKPQ